MSSNNMLKAAAKTTKEKASNGSDLNPRRGTLHTNPGAHFGSAGGLGLPAAQPGTFQDRSNSSENRVGASLPDLRPGTTRGSSGTFSSAMESCYNAASQRQGALSVSSDDSLSTDDSKTPVLQRGGIYPTPKSQQEAIIKTESPSDYSEFSTSTSHKFSSTTSDDDYSLSAADFKGSPPLPTTPHTPLPRSAAADAKHRNKIVHHNDRIAHSSMWEDATVTPAERKRYGDRQDLINLPHVNSERNLADSAAEAKKDSQVIASRFMCHDHSSPARAPQGNPSRPISSPARAPQGDPSSPFTSALSASRASSDSSLGGAVFHRKTLLDVPGSPFSSASSDSSLGSAPFRSLMLLDARGSADHASSAQGTKCMGSKDAQGMARQASTSSIGSAPSGAMAFSQSNNDNDLAGNITQKPSSIGVKPGTNADSVESDPGDVPLHVTTRRDSLVSTTSELTEVKDGASFSTVQATTSTRLTSEISPTIHESEAEVDEQRIDSECPQVDEPLINGAGNDWLTRSATYARHVDDGEVIEQDLSFNSYTPSVYPDAPAQPRPTYDNMEAPSPAAHLQERCKSFGDNDGSGLGLPSSCADGSSEFVDLPTNQGEPTSSEIAQGSSFSTAADSSFGSQSSNGKMSNAGKHQKLRRCIKEKKQQRLPKGLRSGSQSTRSKSPTTHNATPTNLSGMSSSPEVFDSCDIIGNSNLLISELRVPTRPTDVKFGHQHGVNIDFPVATHGSIATLENKSHSESQHSNDDSHLNEGSTVEASKDFSSLATQPVLTLHDSSHGATFQASILPQNKCDSKYDCIVPTSAEGGTLNVVQESMISSSDESNDAPPSPPPMASNEEYNDGDVGHSCIPNSDGVSNGFTGRNIDGDSHVTAASGVHDHQDFDDISTDSDGESYGWLAEPTPLSDSPPTSNAANASDSSLTLPIHDDGRSSPLCTPPVTSVYTPMAVPSDTVVSPLASPHMPQQSHGHQEGDLIASYPPGSPLPSQAGLQQTLQHSLPTSPTDVSTDGAVEEARDPFHSILVESMDLPDHTHGLETAVIYQAASSFVPATISEGDMGETHDSCNDVTADDVVDGLSELGSEDEDEGKVHVDGNTIPMQYGSILDEQSNFDETDRHELASAVHLEFFEPMVQFNSILGGPVSETNGTSNGASASGPPLVVAESPTAKTSSWQACRKSCSSSHPATMHIVDGVTVQRSRSSRSLSSSCAPSFESDDIVDTAAASSNLYSNERQLLPGSALIVCKNDMKLFIGTNDDMENSIAAIASQSPKADAIVCRASRSLSPQSKNIQSPLQHRRVQSYPIALQLPVALNLETESLHTEPELSCGNKPDVTGSVDTEHNLIGDDVDDMAAGKASIEHDSDAISKATCKNFVADGTDPAVLAVISDVDAFTSKVLPVEGAFAATHLSATDETGVIDGSDVSGANFGAGLPTVAKESAQVKSVANSSYEDGNELGDDTVDLSPDRPDRPTLSQTGMKTSPGQSTTGGGGVSRVKVDEDVPNIDADTSNDDDAQVLSIVSIVSNIDGCDGNLQFESRTDTSDYIGDDEKGGDEGVQPDGDVLIEVDASESHTNGNANSVRATSQAHDECCDGFKPIADPMESLKVEMDSGTTVATNVDLLTINVDAVTSHQAANAENLSEEGSNAYAELNHGTGSGLVANVNGTPDSPPAESLTGFFGQVAGEVSEKLTGTFGGWFM